MSKGEILYVKGMNVSDPESPVDDDSEEDIWDDTKLNQAYDKAVSIANAEIAKRVAMATNSRNSTEGRTETQTPTESLKAKKSKKKRKDSNSKQKKPTSEWKVGMPCRAVYDADGLEYEAFLLRIVNDEECVVRFLGYENSELVAIGSLKPSLGNKERKQQIQEALNNNTEEENDLDGGGRMDCDSERSPGSTDKPRRKQKKSAKKTRKSFSEVPTDLPFHMPDLPNFGNIDFSSMQFPMAAPPPLPLAGDAEEQAMCSMLLSWYCSGYYTGLYQGMKSDAEEQAMCSMLLSWYCSGYYTGLYQGMKRASQQQQQSGSSRN